MTINTATLKDSFVSFGKIDADRAEVIRKIIAQLGDPVTYETYEAARKLFGEVKREKNPNVTDAAVNVAWAALKRACDTYVADQKADGFEFDFVWPEKPKATSEAAVKKQAQRAVPEAVAKAQSVTELEAIAKPSDAIEAAKLDAAIAARKVALVKAETKQAEKSQAEALEARKAAIIERIKAANVDTLLEVEAMLDHDAAVIMAALPLVDVQKAMAKLLKLQATAPAKTQTKRRAKLEAAPL